MKKTTNTRESSILRREGPTASCKIFQVLEKLRQKELRKLKYELEIEKNIYYLKFNCGIFAEERKRFQVQKTWLSNLANLMNLANM